MNSELEKLIHQGMGMQVLLFKGIAVTVWIAAGVIALLGIFAPVAPGEEMAKVFVLGFGVIFVITGFYCWHLAKTMPLKFINLITKTPQDINQAYHVRVQKNGIVAHGVHLKTKSGKKVGLNVPSEKMAKRMLELIKQEIPGVQIK